MGTDEDRLQEGSQNPDKKTTRILIDNLQVLLPEKQRSFAI